MPLSTHARDHAAPDLARQGPAAPNHSPLSPSFLREGLRQTEWITNLPRHCVSPPSSPGSIWTSNGWPLSPGPLAPARAPDSPHTHPALLGPRSRLPPARLHTTPRTRTLYTTLPKCFTPRPGLAHPHVTAITLYTTARPKHIPTSRRSRSHNTRPLRSGSPLGHTRLGRPGP